MVQIDNKKMWESIFKHIRNLGKGETLTTVLKKSLNDQGFMFNDNFEIVSDKGGISPKIQKFKVGDKIRYYKNGLIYEVIETPYELGFITVKTLGMPPTPITDWESWELVDSSDMVKAGNWYVCECNILNGDGITAFKRGEFFYCPKDGWLDVNGAHFELGELNQYFSTATEEEARKAYFVEREKDYVRRKQEDARAKMKFIRLCKESEDALSELEICLYDWLSSDSCGQIDRDTMRSVAKKRAEEVLTIVRKLKGDKQ